MASRFFNFEDKFHVLVFAMSIVQLSNTSSVIVLFFRFGWPQWTTLIQQFPSLFWDINSFLHALTVWGMRCFTRRPNYYRGCGESLMSHFPPVPGWPTAAVSHWTVGAPPVNIIIIHYCIMLTIASVRLLCVNATNWFCIQNNT